MATNCKIPGCTLMLILAVSSLMLIESAVAQQATPSTADFSLKYVDGSYTTREGNLVENKTVYVIIKNQPFTPYIDGNGKMINVYYDILWKDNLDEVWSEPFQNHSRRCLYAQNNGSDYTVVAFLSGGTLPERGQLDFKVQTLVGYYNVTHVHYVDDHNGHTVLTPYNLNGNFVEVDYDVYYFFGEEYGWSNLQTLSVPDGDTLPLTAASSDSPNDFFDTLTSCSFEVNPAQLVALALISVIVGMVLAIALTRKLRKQ